MHRGTLNPRIANTSSPHIYADVQEISSQQVFPETKTRWKDQGLHHPLGQSTQQKSDSTFVEQMDIEPIRNPLIAHQKYLSHSNHNPHPRVDQSTKAMKPPNIETYASHHPSFLQSQDCSMSSYSSSGYDSMTQSPSSLNREQIKNDIPQHSNNLQRKDIQQYSTNYDNVRGHLRGQFVSYTNNRN